MRHCASFANTYPQAWSYSKRVLPLKLHCCHYLDFMPRPIASPMAKPSSAGTDMKAKHMVGIPAIRRGQAGIFVEAPPELPHSDHVPANFLVSVRLFCGSSENAAFVSQVMLQGLS